MFCLKSLFFDMNHHWRGRLPKQKRSTSRKEKLDNVSTRDMVGTLKESLLEKEE